MKVTWWLDGVTMFEDSQWNQVFLWIVKVPQIYLPKFVITVPIGKVLLEKKKKFFLKTLDSDTTNIAKYIHSLF